MSKVLTNNDFKDPAVLAKFAKDYWQIREEIAYMYKLKRRTTDYKEQLNLDKTIEVLRLMIKNLYSRALNYTFEINYDIDLEYKHRYNGHKNGEKSCHWDHHEPHK